ncbi:MAG: GNAT family N-acetyltransferase [Defluviitaleaceae bacterium]|nr:GNAT family N-acetyltransferase [Defluviitaleaceae bacterium]
MNNYKILETERLLLRPFSICDAKAMFCNWASDPEVVRYMPYDACNTLDETIHRISEWMTYFENTAPNSAVFAIELKDSNEIIGTIDFAETDIEARSAEVGYQLGKAWWGNGYATEALRAVVKYVFEIVGLNRLWASYDPRNPGSGRVLQKANMLYEGTLRQCKVRRGELVDSVRYAILAEDYNKKKCRL